MADTDLRAAWEGGIPFLRFVEQAEKNLNLWEGIYRNSTIPNWAKQGACERGQDLRLLVLVEDWCGDASNTVPILARLGDEADCLEMRVLKRDDNPTMMDRYLTNGARSIPIVIALDQEFNERGHWGPRPRELQQWVMDNKDSMPTTELYPQVRRWYAEDKGETTLREVLELF